MLGDTARTTLIIVGAVGVLAAAGGIAIKISNAAEFGQATGLLSRGLLGVLSAALLVFALVNPWGDHFRVTKATVLIKPSSFRGRCPVRLALIGRIATKGGSGNVRYDLGLSFHDAPHERVRKLGDGDSVDRAMTVRRSGSGLVRFVILAPQDLVATFPVRYVCTKKRRGAG